MSPSDPSSPSGDLAGRDFWNSLWGEKSEERREIGSPDLQRWEIPHAELFDRAFSLTGDPRGKEILEIGAGDSGWLPYFSKRWGLRVSGLDYSPNGCRRANELVQRAGTEANIVLADMFEPPESLIGSFDFVLSIGVVEHYADTAGTLAAMARFLRPGGILITTAPNIPGLVGDLFKVMNRPVYDIHVPIDAEAMRRAHEAAGLEVVEGGYFMSINLGIPNVAGLRPGFGTRLKSIALMGMIAFSRMVWWFERHVAKLPAHHYLAPYVVAIARAPAA
jgi:2-polyprenyl-3-methyl-5-hydroxy-6-metoxy-1,4-benzoquinol methylase